jgi:hypothetical protein
LEKSEYTKLVLKNRKKEGDNGEEGNPTTELRNMLGTRTITLQTTGKH